MLYFLCVFQSLPTANVLLIDLGGLSKHPVSIPTKGCLKINVY